MKICFVIERVGPYHAFRLRALGGQHTLSVIETRANSQRYAWQENIAATGRIYQVSETSAGEIDRLLGMVAPDVVFLSGYGFKEMLWAMSWCIRQRVPVVMQSDTTVLDEPKRWWKEGIKRFLLSHVAAAFVAGRRSRGYMHSLGMKDKAVFQPYDVIDNDFFSQAVAEKAPGEVPYFLCVSRLIPSKNIAFLLNAFNELPDKHVQLVILGNGELEKALKEQATTLGLLHRVHFKGFLHMEEVRGYYHHALAMVLASTSEPWGLCVNEAIAAGTPVIVSDHAGAAADLVEHEKSGFVFSPFDQQALVQCMQTVMALSASDRKAMTDRAKELLAGFDAAEYTRGVYEAANFAIAQRRAFPLSRLRAGAVLKIAGRAS